MAARKPAISNGGQLIQSTLGTAPNPGNFELVVLEAGGPNGKQLAHWYRDNSATDFPWNRGSTISMAASDQGAIIQSSYGPGNLEVLVREGQQIRHFWRAPGGTVWNPTKTFSQKATGAPSFIQGTYGGQDGNPTNFEAVILEGNELVHYWRNNSDPDQPWQASATISMDAISAGSIIQSPVLGPGSPGPLNVVVVENSGLVHYWRDDSTGQWSSGEVLANDPSYGFTAGCLLQSTFVEAEGAPGNFEFLLTEPVSNPNEWVAHYYRDNVSLNWNFTSTIAPFTINPGTIIQSTFGAEGSDGNFEAVFIVNPGNLVHAWRSNSPAQIPWSDPIFITTVPV